MKIGPFISVCIPVYNAEAYISECIESVLNQSFTDLKSMNCNINIILRYILVIVLFQVSYSLSAKEHKIQGSVVDNLHKQPIPGMYVTLLRLDSTTVSACTVTDRKYDNPPRTIFILPVKEEGKYILRFNMIGYQTTYKDIDVRFRKNSTMVNVGRFEISEEVYKLKETSIVATKIKMVLKGDTIQYNADAFQMAEGSMLDALVSQLPGVELKDNGQIFVNGKYVQELLLNGKNFFKGDPKVALENLPAYMIDKVKVYDKSGEMSMFMNRDMGDKEYVMDVHLKKQYSIGWIANADLGGGTAERYMARLFGLRFTPNSQLTAFVNLNNTNDNRQPGKNGNWRPSNTPTGLQTTQMGGLSYNLERVGKRRLTFTTDNKVTHYDANDVTNTNSVTFLSDGDMFSRSYNHSQDKQTTYISNTGVNFWENSEFSNAKYVLNLNEYIFYSKSNTTGYNRMATFSSNPSELSTGSMLDSLFSPNMGNAYRQILINRQQQERMSKGDYFKTNTNAGTFIRLGANPLDLQATFQYERKGIESFVKRNLDYFSASGTSSSEYRNQYFNQPAYRHRYIINARYDYNIADNFLDRDATSILLSAYYTFDDDYKSDKNFLYRLDKVQGWETEDELHPLGMLPSTSDALQTAIDLQNSYDSKVHEIQHTFRLRFLSSRIKAGPNKFDIEANLTADALKQKLDYHRNNQYYPLTRHSFLPRPDARVTMKTKFGEIELYYQMKSLSPTITYLLDIRDDSDPLNISLGNRELRNSHTHTTELRFRKNNQKKQSDFSFYSGFRYTKNAIAMGLTYDRETGVRTTQPDNINGNYAINHIINYGQALGKKQRWRIDTHTTIFYNHNVDLVGVEGAVRSMRSVVNNLYLGQRLKLDYRLSSKFSMGAKAECNWTYATGRREDFNTIRATDFNYGLTSLVELPWKLQLSTDLTQYSRRGYEDPEMNKDELVWNARLSKSCMKGNLSFMLDGFDILGNLSNVRRTLNAQGRTESYYNVIQDMPCFT